jgi:hypothetical protein
MTEIEARVADLINFSSNHKPIDFEDAFKSILQNKVSSAIENKKTEVAQRMFATSNPSDDVESEEELEDIETEDQDNA